MKPALKAPRTKRLKLKCDIVLSIFAFKFNLRRYTKEEGKTRGGEGEAGAPPSVVRWCRLTLSNPR